MVTGLLFALHFHLSQPANGYNGWWFSHKLSAGELRRVEAACPKECGCSQPTDRWKGVGHPGTPAQSEDCPKGDRCLGVPHVRGQAWLCYGKDYGCPTKPSYDYHLAICQCPADLFTCRMLLRKGSS